MTPLQAHRARANPVPDVTAPMAGLCVSLEDVTRTGDDAILHSTMGEVPGSGSLLATRSFASRLVADIVLYQAVFGRTFDPGVCVSPTVLRASGKALTDTKVTADIRTKATGTPPVYVFILSWERPIYLWVALDSLYRRTKAPARFVLIDNGSQHSLVHKVIDGFERRSMFYAVHRMKENLPENLHRILDRYLPECGPTFCYVESDISIEESRRACWLATMQGLFDERPKLAMLGSYVDVRDFADIQSTRALYPKLSDEEYSALVKANSPERQLSGTAPVESVVSPFNPPGRLLMLRTEAIRTVGMRSDAALHDALQAQGWETGISTAVLHRHLSLLHVYDEPSYDPVSRAEFFDGITTSADDHERLRLSPQTSWFQRLLGRL